uniref:RRM domain-containing protein n=1 Tax=Eutreptiella gymnastica TaxID=73025 RepID=A0A7S4LI43_9EUGL
MSFGPAKLFVGQIPRTCDENYVRTLFAPFGEVLEVYIMKNKATQENKGAAFVTFADMNAAQLAIRSLDQQLSIPPQTNPLQVRLADSPAKTTEAQPAVPGALATAAAAQAQAQAQAAAVAAAQAAANPYYGLGFPSPAIPMPMAPAPAPQALTPRPAVPKKQHPSCGGRKLFVGQFPRSMSQEELQAILSPFGAIEEVVIFRDRATQESKGAGFVIYSNASDAEKAIQGLHGNKIIAPMKNPMQVKYAEGEAPPAGEPKLFVGMIGKSTPETDVRNLFAMYGNIIEVAIIQKQGQSTGACFVKYDSLESADAAINNLNGKYTMPGAPYPLNVKYAMDPAEKQQQQQQQPAYAPAAAFAPAAYPTAPAANDPTNYFATALAQLSQQMAVASGMGYDVSQQMQQLQALQALQNVAMQAVAAPAPSRPRQTTGPPGANLYVQHIPEEFGDEELKQTFEPFGPVLSAKVFCDKVTGQSRGFGFVSYAIVAHATAAIGAMNGFQIGSNRLVVQPKTERAKPY